MQKTLEVLNFPQRARAVNLDQLIDRERPSLVATQLSASIALSHHISLTNVMLYYLVAV